MARELTDDERRRGFERVDPDADLPLRRGWMSRAEFAAWWPVMTANWRARLRGDAPPTEGDWTWDERHGWLRVQRGPGRSMSGRPRT